jgi:hypothetical protein
VSEHLTGPPELREWLTTQGFRVSPDNLSSQSNLCNWYAWRRSDLTARECECNEGKPAQIVVKPCEMHFSHVHRSAEVRVTGEALGIWFDLKAYSVPIEELQQRRPEIEAALIAAWNALAPNKERAS